MKAFYVKLFNRYGEKIHAVVLYAENADQAIERAWEDYEALEKEPHTFEVN
jgi:hypothetical protein